MRCPSHDLACGPDGLCVLCRRSIPQPAPPSVRAATLLCGLGILVSVAALAYRVGGLLGPHADGWRDAQSTDRTGIVSRPSDDPPPSVRVIVYTTAWCPVCKRAKSWMRAQGIAFEERDVEASATYGREIRTLNPRGSVPTFNVDGQVLIGFDPSAVTSSIQQATARTRM